MANEVLASEVELSKISRSWISMCNRNRVRALSRLKLAVKGSLENPSSQVESRKPTGISET